MTLGLILTSFGLGLRHGIDWDHIAAIADLSSSAESRRRGLFLSFLYAVGHGAVVLVLGIGAIAFGAVLPAGVEAWMGRIVGATLLALGLWILIELVRKGHQFRLRSRWILVFSGTFAGIRRVRDARSSRRLAIAHSHDHDHVGADRGSELAPADRVCPETQHEDAQAHDHAHEPVTDLPAVDLSVVDLSVVDLSVVDLSVVEAESVASHVVGGEAAVEKLDERDPVGDGPRRWFDTLIRPSGGGYSGWRHSHVHHHETRLAGDQPAGPGNGTAAGIGILHGIGIESPTQIAVFVASTSIVGVTAGLGLLVAWVLGLLVANSGLAALAASGLLEAERNFTIYVAVAVFVAVTSIIMGGFLLAGGDGLPGL